MKTKVHMLIIPYFVHLIANFLISKGLLRKGSTYEEASG
jgi:hypothetical protein